MTSEHHWKASPAPRYQLYKWNEWFRKSLLTLYCSEEICLMFFLTQCGPIRNFKFLFLATEQEVNKSFLSIFKFIRSMWIHTNIFSWLWQASWKLPHVFQLQCKVKKQKTEQNKVHHVITSSPLSHLVSSVGQGSKNLFLLHLSCSPPQLSSHFTLSLSREMAVDEVFSSYSSGSRNGVI